MVYSGTSVSRDLDPSCVFAPAKCFAQVRAQSVWWSRLRWRYARDKRRAQEAARARRAARRTGKCWRRRAARWVLLAPLSLAVPALVASHQVLHTKCFTQSASQKVHGRSPSDHMLGR